MSENVRTNGIISHTGNGTPNYISPRGGIFMNIDTPTMFISNGDGSWFDIRSTGSTSSSGVEISGITFNDNILTLLNSTGGTLTTFIDNFSGLTVNGNVTVTGITSTSILTATTITGLTTNVNELRFNADFTGGTAGEGIMFWDEDNGTVSLGMHGGVVSQQIGLEQYYYIKNQSGATIEDGRVVRAAGTLGTSGRILGEYMIADGSIEAKYALGIATEDIVNGDDGYVTEFGLVRGINTTGSLYGESWADGDILYVSPTISGGLTKVRPIAPHLHIEMAIVILSHTNGSIFVRPNRYPSLGDLQSVYLNGNTNGDLLTLSGNTWTASKTLNGSYTITGNTTIGGGLTANTISATTYQNLPPITISLSLNGQGNVITTGSTGYRVVERSGNITHWYVIADTTGSTIFDIKRSGVSIIGAGNKPTLSNQIRNNAIPSSWTSVVISANDELEFVVDSASTITKAWLFVQIT